MSSWAYLDGACRIGQGARFVPNRSPQKGTKVENNGKDKPIEEAVMDYFQFRKELKYACDAKGWEIRRYGSHMYYSLCDQNEVALLDRKNEKIAPLADSINRTLLEAVHDCLPLMASIRQIRGGDFKIPRTDKIAIATNPLCGDYAIRTLQDQNYADSLEAQYATSYHFELRRTHPGPDNQMHLGCDPFVASTALLAGAVELGTADWQARAVPVKFPGKRKFSQCCDEMEGSVIGKAILGEELLQELAAYLKGNQHLYKRKPGFGELEEARGSRSGAVMYRH